MRLAAAHLLIAATALAGHRDNDTPDELYIDAGRRWAAVTCEVSGEERRGLRAKGSGVAISQDWVLTAAHVISDAPRDVRVRFADGTTVEASAVFQEPRFDKQRIGFHDIALVKLARSLSEREYPPLAEARMGSGVSVVGFGMFGKLDGGDLSYDGRLRAGNAIVRHTENTCVVCFADRGCCRLLYCPASGDSGGPLFDDDGNLVGLHSYTARPAGRRRGNYGEESCHTNVWLYRDWIADTTENN